MLDFVPSPYWLKYEGSDAHYVYMASSDQRTTVSK